MQKTKNSIKKSLQKSTVINNKTITNTRKSRSKTSSVSWLEEAYDTAQGETALWVAVITQAMMDALSKCKKSDSQFQKSEAKHWLTSSSKDFIDVCIAAGLNPDYVRRKAKKALTSPSPWRAEAGKGKRYAERKKYREKQQTEKQKPQTDNYPKVISIC